jgi:hypothetical protein
LLYNVILFQYITPTVDSLGRDKAGYKYLKNLVPEYSSTYKYNIMLPTDFIERNCHGFYRLQVQLHDVSIITTPRDGIVQVFNCIYKHNKRACMIHHYGEAELCNLVVSGTTNKTEMIWGDFCTYSDGGTDIEAITYPYKNQIFQLARHLNVILEIIKDREKG